MTVYVDEVVTYPPTFIRGQARMWGRKWSHLMADSEAELHEFAQSIGMPRKWFQDHPIHPHYDLVPSRRQRALDKGAIFVPAIDQAKKRLGL